MRGAKKEMVLIRVLNFLLNKKYYLKAIPPKKQYFPKMQSLKHKLRIVWYHGKFMFLSWDITFIIFPIIPSSSKVVTSWWILSQEGKNIFEYISWIINHFVMKLGQLIDIVKDNNLKKIFAWLGELCFKYPLLFIK